MIQSAITISLVEETHGGPFVFSNGLVDSCRRAAEAGFDAVEIFPRAAEAINPKELKQLLQKHRLKLAAMGTGAGWIVHGLRLTDGDAAIRKKARAFIAGVVDLAGKMSAPAI